MWCLSVPVNPEFNVTLPEPRIADFGTDEEDITRVVSIPMWRTLDPMCLGG